MNGEQWLRALAIAAGTMLAALCLATGMDGMTKVMAGVLVGFGVGKGLDLSAVTTKVRTLKRM